MSNSKRITADIQRVLFSEYHVVISLILLTYPFWLRIRYGQTPIEGIPSFSLKSAMAGETEVFFSRWEWQAGITFASMAAWRVRKESSCLDAAIFSASLFTQLFVCFMSFLISKALFLTYAIAFFLAFLILRQPDPDNSDKSVEAFTPTVLQQRTRGDQVKPGQAVIVLFHADFSLASHHAICQFAEIARDYRSEQTVFATLDIGQWRNSPLLSLLHIDVSAASPSLPSIILWEKGEEQSRLPRKYMSSGGFINRSTIIAAFELDMRRARALKA